MRVPPPRIEVPAILRTNLDFTGGTLKASNVLRGDRIRREFVSDELHQSSSSGSAMVRAACLEHCFFKKNKGELHAALGACGEEDMEHSHVADVRCDAKTSRNTWKVE